MEMNIDSIAKVAQGCFKKCPTVVLGSGASIPHGLPGMRELSKWLLLQLRAESDVDNNCSNVIKALEDGDHFEAALDRNDLSDALLSKIVASVWQCVNKHDSALLRSAATNGEKFPLGRLLSGMFDSTHREVNIVTTNYDRVAEYACNAEGLLFHTGFAPGYIQKWESSNRVEFCRRQNRARIVKIWKVHGSLDWFQTSDGRIVGLPVFELPSEGYGPLIVTPGLNKYKKTHEDPFRTTISEADKVLGRASAFLCVGFGFRDQHVHPKITERCWQARVPIVVLAKQLTEEAKDFLRSKAGNNYLGIEQADTGSRVYSADFPDGDYVEEADLWTLSGYCNLVL